MQQLTNTQLTPAMASDKEKQELKTLNQSLYFAQGFAEVLPDSIFCGFMVKQDRDKVTKELKFNKDGTPRLLKLPISITSKVGIKISQENASEHLGAVDKLGLLHDIEYIGLPFYAGMSQTANGYHLICLDVDLKRATEPSKQAQAIEAWAKANGHYFERSHSGKGFHIFVAVQDTSQLPEKFALDVAGAEVEIFSREAIKCVMLTGEEVRPNAYFEDVAIDLMQEIALLGIDIKPKTAKPKILQVVAPVANPKIDANAYGFKVWVQNTLVDLESALAFIAPDDYETWIAGGMALKTLPNDQGREVFHQWSARFSDYDYEQAQAKWESFDPTKTSSETILKRARDAGWVNARDGKDYFETTPEEFEIERRKRQREENELIGQGINARPPKASILAIEEMLARFVWLSDGSRVADIFDPRFPLTFHDWQGTYSASKLIVPTNIVGKNRAVQISTLWRDHAHRMTATSITFKAGAGLLVNNPDGVPCVNTWIPYDRSLTVDDIYDHSIELFKDHINMLFGEDAPRFLAWFAHIEQKPHELPHTSWLHISIRQGMGRNWVAGVAARLWAGKVAVNLNTSIIEGNFNGRLAGKVLAIVDEAHEGTATNKYQLYEKLKNRITAEFVEINPKYGRSYTEFNACRWLFFSNNLAALPLNDEDRRMEVSLLDTEVRDADYYSVLYGTINDPLFIAAVAKYLATYDISDFNAGSHAKTNHAKVAVQEANKSALDINLSMLKNHWPCDLIAGNDLISAITETDTGHFESLNSARVKRALESIGISALKTARFPCLQKPRNTYSPFYIPQKSSFSEGNKGFKSIRIYALKERDKYITRDGSLIHNAIKPEAEKLVEAFENIEIGSESNWLYQWVLDSDAGEE